MEEFGGGRRRRVVLVPYPYQGHISPMLHLGSILDSKGFSITITHPNFNSLNPSNYPKFTFLPLPVNLDGYDNLLPDLLNVTNVMLTNCEASFEDHMVQMLKTGEVACVIFDNVMKFAYVVANRLKLPAIVMRATGAASLRSYTALFQLADEKRLPLPESEMQDLVPNMYPLRFKDLPLPLTQEIPEPVLDFQLNYMDIESSPAVIWNTIEPLEHWSLQQLQRLQPVPFFSIGPIHEMSPPLPTSLVEEDTTCLKWLDSHAPNSVIYISFGSLATVDEKELCEIAWGLAKSEQPFLWVIRLSLLNGLDAVGSLPEEFKRMVGERGLIVNWAPQKKVLKHVAVGGFLSHCGWNSILESLAAGVPLICRPCFGDQSVNMRCVTHVWKVGIELETTNEISVERAVRTLMESEDGKGMRKRALELKLEIEKSMSKGGSAYESLDQLLKFIDALSDRN